MSVRLVFEKFGCEGARKMNKLLAEMYDVKKQYFLNSSMIKMTWSFYQMSKYQSPFLEILNQ